jgi:hypothetical protein
MSLNHNTRNTSFKILVKIIQNAKLNILKKKVFKIYSE